MRISLWSVVSCTVVLLAAFPAAAQLGNKPFTESNIHSGAPKAPNKPSDEPPPPPAVPGARARGSVAPADRTAADLPPTEALFDAINRGDIITARDAISRGADLDGTNLLGLTPLELSVDLGRNDISFLLLSLRGSGSGSAGSRPPQGTEEATAAPASPAERRRALAEARAQARAAKLQTASAAPAVPARRGPALFAGDGGAAVPSAGFLGFDPHR